MRNDERYRQKPMSNQLEIFGLGADGEHPRAWDFMVEQATRLNRKGYVSINYLIHMVRNELHVGVKNGLAPSLARIMEARYPHLRHAFNKHRSKSDGFVDE